MKEMKISVDSKHYDGYADEGSPETELEIINDKSTDRGFSKLEFKDKYGQICRLQNSSLATEGAIWLGVDNTGPHLDGPTGKKNENVHANMHLTRKQVETLLPYFKVFVERGYIPNDIKPEKEWENNVSVSS
jgi:hypothetical protein